MTLFEEPPAEVVPRTEGWLDQLPPSCEVLRSYQTELLERTAGAMRETHQILVQAPTGAGKTHIICGVVSAATRAGLKVLILATRTRLVRQLHERLRSFEIPHDVLAAALRHMRTGHGGCTVASVDTLYRRCIVDEKFPLPAADVVIFDEAHLALGESRKKLLAHYAQAWLFGFTATPAKTSGRPLREQFAALVVGPSVKELIALGMLVRPRIFNFPVMEKADLKAIRKDSKSGDYVSAELSALMSRPKLVGDVVENWLRIANGKRTLVFSVDKGHGSELVAHFKQAGVPVEQLTDDDDDDTREMAISRLERGETLVLVNCFLLSYGIDIPLVDCIVLARPTRSVVLYLQAVGRGMRPADGKDSVTIIDHGRVVESLGMPTDDYGWSLHTENVNKSAAAKLKDTRQKGDEKPRTCPKCSTIWLITELGSDCPECGWKITPKRNPVQVRDAQLQELDASPEQLKNIEQQRQFYCEAMGWYARRWPDRWAESQAKGKSWAFRKTYEWIGKDAPRMESRHWSMKPVEPSPKTAGWLKASVIRWAKSSRANRQSDGLV